MPVISEPVPAVVGTQTIGTDFSGKDSRARRKSETGASEPSMTAASLPASSAEPPPRHDDRLAPG